MGRGGGKYIKGDAIRRPPVHKGSHAFVIKNNTRSPEGQCLSERVLFFFYAINYCETRQK